MDGNRTLSSTRIYLVRETLAMLNPNGEYLQTLTSLHSPLENETKTLNAQIWFNIMGYECQDDVINNPRFIEYRIIARKVSREINIS